MLVVLRRAALPILVLTAFLLALTAVLLPWQLAYDPTTEAASSLSERKCCG